MRRRSTLFALLPLALLFAACSPVESLPRGTCGNGVVDPDEDCDIHPSQGYDCRQPGEAWQCSFVCDQGRCPAGYGCGTDDVCRKPSGTIESVAFAEVPSQARQLFAGDFDADRRADVVGFESGRARVSFLGASGDVQQVSFSAFVRPSIGKMGPLPAAPGEAGADTTDDLCQALNLGIGASLSDGDRTFTAKTFGSITIEAPPELNLTVLDSLPLAFDGLPQAPDGSLTGDETGALVAQRNDKTGETLPYGALVNFGVGPVRMVLRVQDGLPENLAGPPVSGNFDLADDCHELAFPIRMGIPGVDPVVRVYKPCEPLANGKGYGWRIASSESDGLLSEIRTIYPVGGSVFPLHADGDDVLDLLITVKVEQPGEEDQEKWPAALEVAYGVGDGTFHSTTPVPAVGPGDNHTSFYANMPNGEAPLAIGDLSLDGIPDAVDPTQVLLGTPSLGGAGLVTFGPVYQSPRTWTEAVIADINANGRPDVLACAAGAPDIDILNGNLPAVFNPSQISTDGTVSKLTAGDFDGDLVNDIAYQDSLSPEESLLSVAYGRTAGGPEEPAEIGRFLGIEHIVQGNAHNFGIDNITDLGVQSRNAAGKLTMSFFPGDGNRVVQSPFLLTGTTGIVHLPLLTALGPLRARGPGEELHNDLAALAYIAPQISDKDSEDEVFEKVTSALWLWGLFGTGEADFDTTASLFCPMPKGSIFLPGFEETTSLVVSSAPAGERGRVFATSPFARKLPGGGVELGSILVEARFDGGTCEVMDAKDPPFSGMAQLLFRVQTADLDGDDQPEVIGLLRGYDVEELGKHIENLTPGGPPISPESSHLVIFWDGVLGNGAELLPNMPPGQPGTVSDFTTGDIDGDGRPEVIVVGSENAVIYSLGPDGESLVAEGTLGSRAPDAPPTPDAAGADAVLLADADGDGVNDLVVSKGGLRFYKGRPRPELVNPVEQ